MRCVSIRMLKASVPIAVLTTAKATQVKRLTDFRFLADEQVNAPATGQPAGLSPAMTRS